MTSPNPKIKKIIITVVVIILAVVLYIYFSNKSSTPVSTSSLESQSGIANTSLSNEEINKDTSFLTTLLSLGKTTIDPAIFSSSSFKSLQDNTVEISSNDTIGRLNPFIPFDQTIPSDQTTTLPQILPTDTTEPSVFVPTTITTIPAKNK